MRKLLLITLFLSATFSSAGAQTVSIGDLQLVTPADPINVLTLDLDASILGSDRDQAELSGNITADLDLVRTNHAYSVTGLTFTGGTVFMGDVSFGLLGGLVTADSSGLAGTLSTISPPGLVTAGTFAAADHELEVNQGSITAAGNSIDFATLPFASPGTGTGIVSLSAGSPLPGFDVLDITISLDIDLSETFVIPDVPFFGDVDATLSGSGTIVSMATIQVPVSLPGDYDEDGALGCGDIDLLAAAVRSGSLDLGFDVDGNGIIDNSDFQSWVTDLKGTVLGDANFDYANDVSDFNIWTSNKFALDRGWCQGDFNGDGLTDVSDFNVWTNHRFTQASSTLTVPEPDSAWLGLGLCGAVFWAARRR